MNRPDAIMTIYKPLIKRVAVTTLLDRKRNILEDEQGRFTKTDIKLILSKTWEEYGSLKTEIPKFQTLGNQMNAQLACLTLSCWNIMKQMKIDPSYSLELISDLAWSIYRKWSWIVKMIARMQAPGDTERLRTAVRTFLKFPFSSPGYEIEVQITPEGINLDVKKCMVAEYFQQYEAQDLCVKVWCNQDFAMAEMWGGKLERTTTLAEGCEQCEFRFKLE